MSGTDAAGTSGPAPDATAGPEPRGVVLAPQPHDTALRTVLERPPGRKGTWADRVWIRNLHDRKP